MDDAASLPANSKLEERVEPQEIPDGSGRMGPGLRTYWLNGQQISRERYDQLVPVFAEASKRACHEQGHLVPKRCPRCGQEGEWTSC